MGGWREEWETEGYRHDLTGRETDFLRVRMRIERGILVRYTAQYETVSEGRVYAVVRFDTAHGRPHRDVLNRSGRVIHKRWLPAKAYDEALADATDDIKANWPAYRAAFERMTR